MSLNTILATAPLATTGFHIKATGTTLGNSLIWDNGTNVGIGNTNTSYTLDVSGTGRFTSTLLVSGAATFSGFVGINGSPATSFPLEAYINSSTAYSSTSRGNVMRVYNSNTSANIFAGIELGGAGTANDGLAGLNAVVTGSGSAALTFYTRDSNTFAERMRITSAGNVGIGTSSPNIVGFTGTVLTVNGTGNYQGFEVATSGTSRIVMISDGSNGYISTRQSGMGLFFEVGAASEAMRINSAKVIGINSANTSARLNMTFGGSGQNGFSMLDGDNASNVTFIDFKNSSGTIIGYIGRAGLTNAVVYSTNGSDITLKKNIEDWEEKIIDKFDLLEPKLFNYKEEEDGTEKTKGYIANDAVNYFPEAYPKNIDGIYSFNPSGMVVYLMKAIQEQQIQIQNLQEQINILAK